MIHIKDISKSFGEQQLFSDVSFNINKGERIGLIGRNGSGKSTLFKILLRETEPDSGRMFIPVGYRIGHLDQHISFSRETILEEASLGLGPEDYESEWKVKKILSGLGFSEKDLQSHPASFSGGFQVRLMLAKLLISSPELLLLDEPNNYLDIIAIRWLEKFLREWKGELMLITHERYFMDNIISHCMILHRQKARKIEGNTVKLYNQVSQDEEIYEKTRLNEEKKKKQLELYISRFKAKAALAKSVQSVMKRLAREDIKEELQEIDTLDFSFTGAEFEGDYMMSVSGLGFSYTPENPLIRNLSIDIGKKERFCVIGKNGKGKSTLLKLLAGELEPLSGKIKKHPALEIAYFEQTNISKLRPENTVLEELMSSSPECSLQRARNIAGLLMFSGDLALKKISVLSGGEKSRVLLGKMLVTPAHLLLLDEPTNHLDMDSCEAMLAAIDEFPGSVIIVTHNEMYLHRLAKRLIIFDKEKVGLYEGSYADFLRFIGWENEDMEDKKIPALRDGRPGNENNWKTKQEQKKTRAKLIQEKSRIIGPIKEKISRLEKNIQNLESGIKDSETLLIKASNECNVAAIREISVTLSRQKKELEASYSEYDRQNKTLEIESLKLNQLL